MSNEVKNYYYNKQIKRYIVQFMEIFRNMYVHTGIREDGEIREMPVALSYGSRDRVTSAILANNTQNAPIRIPAMSAYVKGINLAPESRKGVGGVRRETFLPKGGMMPDDIQTIRQLMPVPYSMDIDISIWTSNTDQQFQILEQILMFFDPILQIQTSDEEFDWTKISIVELMGINFDEQWPIGTERRIISTTLSFKVPMYITGPNELKNSFVRDVFARITAVSNMDDFIESIYTAQDSEYEKMWSADDLVL